MKVKDLKEILKYYKNDVDISIVVDGKVAELKTYEEFVIEETQEPTNIYLSDKEITEDYFNTFQFVQ